MRQRTYSLHSSQRFIRLIVHHLIGPSGVCAPADGVAIELVVISLSLSLPSSAKSPRRSYPRLSKFYMGS